MSALLDSVLGSELKGPEWLSSVRSRGREYVGRGQLPTLKTEDWQYTSLRAVKDTAFETSVSDTDHSGLEQECTIGGLDCHRLVFVNGHFNPGLSSLAEEGGIDLVPFSKAGAEVSDLILQHLGTLADGDGRLFTALNDSVVSDGLFLRVGRNVRLEKPVHAVWLGMGHKADIAISQRLLVVLEEGADATVIEHFIGSDNEGKTFTNGVSEFVVGDNARLAHYRLNLAGSGTAHIGQSVASLGRSATLKGFHVALGGQLVRNDIHVFLRGEGAHCELNGVYLPRDRELVDYHTTLEHEVPHCTSEETFRGIVADESRAVFNGRIHIHPGAQKTVAQLNNRNLLTSDRAEVDTKPELEIYADDVQCAHGATIAQVDETQLHYLRTRGISAAEANVLLSFGFVNEIVNRIAIKELNEFVRKKMRGHFARDEKLMRHLA